MAWSARKKGLFRVGPLYFALHLVPYPLSSFESMWWLTSPMDQLKGSIVHELGVRWLALPAQRATSSGCGDRAGHYLGVGFELGIALAGAALWGWLDRRRPDYRRLAYWATVALRYYLASTMLEYGIIKILKSQFPFRGRVTCPHSWGTCRRCACCG